MSLQYTNNAETILTSSLSATSTTLNLPAGAGEIFPDLNTGDWFPLTLLRSDLSEYEIVRVTGKVGDTLTIERGTEGTDNFTFGPGDVASLRITKAFVDEFALNADRDLTILRGVNFGRATGSVTGNLYNVVVKGVSEYVDDLRVSFLPHSSNRSGITTRLDVNTLGPRDVVNPDGTPLEPNAIEDNRRAEVHYDLELDSFVLDNAVPPALTIPTATTTVFGLATRSTASNFDLAGNNTAFQTQRTVSAIVKEYVDQQLSEIFDRTFIRYGRAVRGDFNITAAQSRSTGLLEEYRNFTVGPGGILTLNGGNTTVIRATQSINITGSVIVNNHQALHPERMIGGRGTDQGDIGQISGVAPEIVPAQIAHIGTQALGATLSQESFDANIITVSDLQLFHGGHGRGATDEANGNHRTPGRAGLILIAPVVNIGAGALIDIRSNRGAGTAGHGAGGQIVVATPALTLNASANFVAGDGSTTANAGHWNTPANDNENGGGANGQMWHINTLTGETANIF